MGLGREQLAENITFVKLAGVKKGEVPYFQVQEKVDGKYEGVELKTVEERRRMGQISGQVHKIETNSYEWEEETKYTVKVVLLDKTNGKDDAFYLDIGMSSLGRTFINQLMDSGIKQGDELKISVWLGDANDNGDQYPAISTRVNDQIQKSKYEYKDLTQYVTQDTVKGKKRNNYDELNKHFAVKGVEYIHNSGFMEAATSRPEPMELEQKAAENAADKKAGKEKQPAIAGDEDAADELPF